MPESNALANLNRMAANPLLAMGMGLGVLSTLVAMFAPGQVVVHGPGRGFNAGQDVSLDLPGPVIVVFIALAVLLIAAMVIPARWAGITGIGVLWAACMTYGVMVMIGRSNERFAVDGDLTLGRAGAVLAVATAIALAGVILALVGSRRLARPPRVPLDEHGNALTGARTSGHATTALVLGICSVLAPVGAALAIVFSNLATGEINLSNGHRTGRGMAVAGLVLGIVWMSLTGLVLLVGIFAASPSSSG